MSSISIRFALASVSVALFVLAFTGGVSYLFLKKELLDDAIQKAQLMEQNSRYQIEALIAKAEKTSTRLKKVFQEGDFSKAAIKERLTKMLEEEDSFFGTTIAFKPTKIYKTPFSPYYYKEKGEIHYRDLASKDYNYLTKEWYKIPLEQSGPLWSEPYFDEGGGDMLMATYSNPIFYKEELVAILTVDLTLKKIQEMISAIEILDSGYAFILSNEHKILAHKDPALIMQIYDTKPVKHNEMIKEKEHWTYYANIKNTKLTLAIVFPIDELFSSLHYMSIIHIILATIGAILLIVTMALISRRVTEPLRELTRITDDIAKSDFDKKITLPKTHDEIYKLSLAIDTMQKAIKKYIKDLRIATMAQQKIDSELDIARSIQRSMLPKGLSENENIRLCAMLKPARAVGGDFYDFFYIDEEHLCFLIADVSGKGVPAAMFMSVTRSYLRAYSTIGLSASEIVVKLNNTIASNNDANMFVTLFLGILNVKSGELNYTNAGHDEPYLLSEAGKYKRLKAVGNTVVGAFENLPFRDETIFLTKNSKLFLYTDGVTEAFSKDDEQFGDRRVSDALATSQEKSVNQTMQFMEKSITDFTKDCEQSDDITMLLLEFKL
ncbi:hypothetical protein M947_10960 [Sulfurimonas hongkongensis]|uniref:HAMP domain-containing protein n=1 Tax=Sulfurimonas hongkongensis TaxID=1172190 RepID=T0KLX6_9BACT|nr:SpoIIE family protein phosphatase [Sulfurimonas hongkongensis]EQB34393.1 hypothetical protein M947_10960 [Sulfurimonas hongkongensis]